MAFMFLSELFSKQGKKVLHNRQETSPWNGMIHATTAGHHLAIGNPRQASLKVVKRIGRERGKSQTP
jgi:hypothetical protein